MPWWVLIPVVSMITGPVAMYLMTRHNRRVEELEERYEELEDRYTALLEETGRTGLPGGRKSTRDSR